MVNFATETTVVSFLLPGVLVCIFHIQTFYLVKIQLQAENVPNINFLLSLSHGVILYYY